MKDSIQVRKVQNLGDNRNKGSCVHSGGPNETRDHAPSIVFLDDPLPPDLPASPSCAACNQGFSNDEAYFACLLECVIVGDAKPALVRREKIAALMRRRPKLTAEMTALKRYEGDRVVFSFDHKRIENVVLKLARCHVAYEMNEPRIDEPELVWFQPLSLMAPEAIDAFENDQNEVAVWPEVGSRAMHRLLVADDNAFSEGWLNIQPDRYRYKVTLESGLRVRIVLREYLACEVLWN